MTHQSSGPRSRPKRATHRPCVARTHALDAAATREDAQEPRHGSAELVLNPLAPRRDSLGGLHLLSQVFDTITQTDRQTRGG